MFRFWRSWNIPGARTGRRPYARSVPYAQRPHDPRTVPPYADASRGPPPARTDPGPCGRGLAYGPGPVRIPVRLSRPVWASGGYAVHARTGGRANPGPYGRAEGPYPPYGCGCTATGPYAFPVPPRSYVRSPRTYWGKAVRRFPSGRHSARRFPGGTGYGPCGVWSRPDAVRVGGVSVCTGRAGGGYRTGIRPHGVGVRPVLRTRGPYGLGPVRRFRPYGLGPYGPCSVLRDRCTGWGPYGLGSVRSDRTPVPYGWVGPYGRSVRVGSDHGVDASAPYGLGSVRGRTTNRGPPGWEDLDLVVGLGWVGLISGSWSPVRMRRSPTPALPL